MKKRVIFDVIEVIDLICGIGPLNPELRNVLPRLQYIYIYNMLLDFIFRKEYLFILYLISYLTIYDATKLVDSLIDNQISIY